MTLYINVGHCFSDIYGQIIVCHGLSDIYGQVIVVCPSECIHLHCCFILQVNTDKMERMNIRYIFILTAEEFSKTLVCFCV